ncbi:hypothetical protein LOTGIDRAFT_159724 [Lottia gigantea]|uniref:G-protein coupled receptors family 1 profile domain-containing protein n=1 Tax=Lottia gigantea TaxID=225164 RepID=V4ATC7_LOTGI|nr:hypothetical protein LOTGIDRAFT_159724 [Lottia gigantea]ESO96976.1 hypothetical protein LOTGIDRAFT_159724 [Lottia gigantea]
MPNLVPERLNGFSRYLHYPEIEQSWTSELTKMAGNTSNILEDMEITMARNMSSDTKAVCAVLTPIICSTGIVGNILSLMVLTRKEMTSVPSCFLKALCVCDLCILLIQFPDFFKFNDSLMKMGSFIVFYRYYKIVWYVIANYFLTCACWIITAMAIERCVSLYFLTKTKMICTILRARVSIGGITMVSLVLNFFRIFEYVPNTNPSHPAPYLTTRFGLSKGYIAYNYAVGIVLVSVIPLIMLVTFNSFLVCYLIMHRKRVAKTGLTSSVDPGRVSVVVATMVIIFIMCHSIGVYVSMHIALVGRAETLRYPMFHRLSDINNLLKNFNTSINFLLFCVISKKFRKILKRVLKRQKEVFTSTLRT